MAARTGEQFLRGLAGRRDLWVGGDKVSSVVDHPALSGAARALAEVFDLQHRHAEVCLMPDSETGEPIKSVPTRFTRVTSHKRNVVTHRDIEIRG